jgi:hypothetical protein
MGTTRSLRSLTDTERGAATTGDPRPEPASKEICDLLQVAISLLELEAVEHAEGRTLLPGQRKSVAETLRAFNDRARSALKLARGEK